MTFNDDENDKIHKPSNDLTIEGQVTAEQVSLNSNYSAIKDTEIYGNISYDKGNGVAINAGAKTKFNDLNVESNISDTKENLSFNLGGSNSKSLAEQGVVESMDNLLSADYKQKMELLNDNNSTFSFAQTIGYDKENKDITQSTSLMHKFKGEAPAIVQLKQKTIGDNVSFTGVYDSKNFNAKYNFETHTEENAKDINNNFLGQYKGKSVQVVGNLDLSHTKMTSETEIVKSDKIAIDTTVYTNKTSDLNFQKGLYTENKAHLDIVDGKVGNMSITNQTGYTSFANESKKFTNLEYIETEYSRDFENNGHSLYGRVGAFVDCEKFTGEAYVGGKYSTDKTQTSSSLFTQAKAFYRANEILNANASFRYENTYTKPMANLGSRSEQITFGSGVDYKVGNRLTLNASVDYTLGQDKNGWSGQIGGRFTF